MRGRTLALALLVLAGPAVGACSDDGGGDAQPYIDALMESFQEEDEESGFVPSDEQAECLAETTVDAIGADALEEAEITPEELAESDGPQELGLELSDDQAEEAARAFVDCDISFGTAFAGEDASQEAIDCVDENLDEDGLVEAFVLQYQGDEAAAEEQFGEVFEAVGSECEDAFAG